MNLKERLEVMEGAGFRLPRKCHSLSEAKKGINPKTSTTIYVDNKGNLWSWDREGHFDVSYRNANNKYVRIRRALDGGAICEELNAINFST